MPGFCCEHVSSFDDCIPLETLSYEQLNGVSFSGVNILIYVGPCSRPSPYSRPRPYSRPWAPIAVHHQAPIAGQDPVAGNLPL